jgi:UDP-N-acetyl-D-glucosamine dehydrogenase
MQTEFIELAGEVNQAMPYYCVERIARALDERMMPVRGSEILILGVSYKAGVGDLRESPALKIMRLLADRGARLRYHDEHVPELRELGLASEPLETALESADCVAVVTAHPGVDFDRVAAEASALVDFRGVTRRSSVRAGSAA